MVEVENILKLKPQIIKTNRLLLKNISDNDLNRVTYLLTNQEISKTYMVPNFNSEEEVIKLFEILKKISNNEKRFTYGIYLEDNLIGLINDVDIENQTIELGFVIDPEYKNNGYATEVLSKAINVLFEMGYEVINTGAFEENIASIKVMEKSKMTRLNKTLDIDYRGLMHRCVCFQISKN